MFAIELAQAVLRQAPEGFGLSGAWETLDISKGTDIVLDFRVRGLDGLFTAVCSLLDDPGVETRCDCKIEYLRYYWDYYGYLEADQLRLLNNRGGLDQLGLCDDVVQALALGNIMQIGQLRKADESYVSYLCPGTRGEGFMRTAQEVDNTTWARLEDVRIALAKVGLQLAGPRLSYSEMQQLL